MPRRLSALAEFYAVNARHAVAVQFQYRFAHFLRLLGFMIEPVVYLVVWTAVIRAGGGHIGGYDAATLSAYYIASSLVRTMNLAFTPYGFEDRIRTGRFTVRMLQPIHPIHHDLSEFAGVKLLQVLVWLPIGVALALMFRPSLHPDPLRIAVFAAALWAAYVLRSLMLWLLGLLTFWTTRVSAPFELFMTVELLLSGRLVPLSFLPSWAQTLAAVLPFKWTFGFPAQAIALPGDARWLPLGLVAQAAWIAVFGGLVAVAWRRAARRYSAVGN